MGRIAAPFGVRGYVRVTPWSEDPATLLEHPVWSLRVPGGAWREFEVVDAAEHSSSLVVQFRGMTSREDAAALRGSEIGLPRDALAPPKEGEYYWSELETLGVVNRTGVHLGEVVGVAGNGAHPILRVSAGTGMPERLIPFVPAYIDRVDIAAKRIEVDWQPDY
jgi:16S rRNA processing protein RimM